MRYTARSEQALHHLVAILVSISFDTVQVEKLRGSLQIQHTLADHGARKLWKLMREEPYVPALGALTGNQAIQMVKGGLKAIYCSGWQVVLAARFNCLAAIYNGSLLKCMHAPGKNHECARLGRHAGGWRCQCIRACVP